MLKVILLSIAGIYLYHDYASDKGQHRKAKIINGIIIGSLIFMYADSFRYIGWMIRKPHVVLETWNTPIGFFTGEVHLIVNLISVIGGTTLMFFASKMTRRNKIGRKWVLNLLPVLSAIEIFSFYRGWISDGNDSMTNQISALGVGALIIGGICLLILKIYQSGFMIDFFNRKSLSTIEI